MLKEDGAIHTAGDGHIETTEEFTIIYAPFS